jgi:hypothetical protein
MRSPQTFLEAAIHANHHHRFVYADYNRNILRTFNKYKAFAAFVTEAEGEAQAALALGSLGHHDGFICRMPKAAVVG